MLAPIDQGTRNLDGREGSAQAPAKVIAALEDRELLPTSAKVREPRIRNTAESLEEDLDALSVAVEQTLAEGRFPIVLGGDHGTTFATVRGATRYLEEASITYLDVHLDMRPYEPVHTSGSSFRRLVEAGYVAAEHVHPLGIVPPPEPTARRRARFDDLLTWARDHKITWVSMASVQKRGIVPLVQRCLDEGPSGCFSFDVDCLDERWAPGVSAPGSPRFSLEEGLAAVRAAAGRCVVLDVVEYVPRLDEDDRTLESVIALVEAFLDARQEA